jgi:two-component system, cell cycle sensor histidine kinase and response regulator CckA
MRDARGTPLSYAIVCALTACALLVSLLLKSIIEPNFFLPFTAVVLVSSWFYGRWAGLLSTILGAMTVDFFFMSPQFVFGFTSWTGAARLITFILSALLVTFLVDELRCSKLELTATLSSIGDAVLVVDGSANVVFLNPIAEAMLGVPMLEARKKPLAHILHLTDEQTGEPTETRIQEILKEGISFQATSHKLLTSKHGHTISIEESAAPIRAERGSITGAILIFRDITTRRQVQDQVTQSQKMEAVGRLAGGVAGDFNNLLTVMTGYSEMLRSEMAAGNPLRRFAEEILTAAERAAGLTRQLLAFSRGQTGQAKLVDLNPLLANMETMLRRLMGEKIDVVFMPGPGIGKVKIDAAQLEQAIVNLAMNSRDAMPKGGKFAIETVDAEITREQAAKRPGMAPGNYVMVAVSDTGTGMNAETRAHLFEPFFTTKGRGKGSGLGLSIVYGIVQQSGGAINVYSEPGAGTIFEIYLPREKDTGLLPLPPAIAGRKRGSETILIADDEDGVRRLVYAVLATNGYTVVETKDGREALAAFEANRAKIDMVLTDVVMPNMNGLELGDRLHSLSPKTKVLYISGYRDSAIGVAERERIFLHKPFTPDALLTKVREILDNPAGRS